MQQTPVHYRNAAMPQQTPTRGGASATPGHHPHQSRRGPGPMVAHPAGAPAHMSQQQLQYQQAQQRQAEHEMAKRRSKKPTDMVIPKEVADICDNSKIYADMRNVERRLDMSVTRKRLDLRDAVNQASKTHKTLRIFVSNTAINQPWQSMTRLDENSFDFDTGLIPSYRMKIEGKWLDDDEEYYSSGEEESDDEKADEDVEMDSDTAEADESKDKTQDEKKDGPDDDTKMEGSEEPSTATNGDGEGKPPKKKRKSMAPPHIPKAPRKFSHFLKKITVEVDRSSLEDYTESNLIEWQRASSDARSKSMGTTQQTVMEFDGFEFERKLDITTACTIKIWLNEHPEVYKLSDDLANVVDTREDTRAGVVMGLWDYTLLNGLQEREDRRMVTCDDNLKKLFKQERIFFPAIPELVLPHLFPREPVTIRHNIRVDIASTDPSIYDVLIPVEDPTRTRMAMFIDSDTFDKAQKPVITEDENVATIIAAIGQSQSKRDFFMNLSTDPAGFIKRWDASNKRDFDLMVGEKGIDSEITRRSNFYDTKAVEENVYMLFHGKDVPPGMRG